MHLIINGHPTGLTLGAYGGIVHNLLTFVANFWYRTGALDCFCISEDTQGVRPTGFFIISYHLGVLSNYGSLGEGQW